MANTLKFGNGEWYGKKDTILAYNDENSNYKPLPFEFSRASSATVVNKAGLIETVGVGEPRIDFSNDAKGALLLERARNNSITYSNTPSQWTDSGVTHSANAIISPDGGLNATKSVANVGVTTANTRPMTAAPITTGSDYVFSVFAKAGEFEKITLDFSNSGFDAAEATYNLTTGTVTAFSGINVNQGIEDYGNGWYRCYIVATAIVTGTAALILRFDDNPTGTGVDGLYFYGASFEKGSYATSYIPTNGSAVTRAAETSSQTVPDGVIGQTEGVAYVEIDWKGNDEESIFSVLHDGTVNNRMDFGYSAVFNSFYFNVRTGGSGQGLMQYASPTIGKYKIAISYKNNDFALWVNGVKEAVDSSGSVPVTTQYNVGNYIGGGREHSIINSKLYNTALTDQELIALTQ